MKITLTERFQRDVEAGALRDIHRHSGLGLRKIHASGIFEARVGLGLRMVFGFEKENLILHRIGTHDEIQRYLRQS